ncbi:hypothetical protein C8R44DRAFT_878479 [Mycena epipterygia]|nr:hypothetical protein C8R44DRAFT_878479 [Mycena epipterygia]
MPSRQAKARVAAAPTGQKRPADSEDASEPQRNAPPAKKARQSASKAAPTKKTVPTAEVIEISSDEEGSESAGEAIPPQKKASTKEDASDDDSEDVSDEDSGEDDANNEGSDEDGEDGDNPRLPRKVRERLEYIETHTDGLTSTYLKFITKGLDNYMGKGGRNSDIAVDIANHCAFQAQLGRSDLGREKRLVKGVYRMCYGACGESEDDSDDEFDDDYKIPKEVTNRLVYCLRMLEGFDLKALYKVIKSLPKYKGRRKGELDDVLEDAMEHLDVMTAKKADVVAEVVMIEKIKDKRSTRNDSE